MAKNDDLKQMRQQKKQQAAEKSAEQAKRAEERAAQQRAAAERAQIEAKKTEIRNEINMKNEEIRELNDKMKQYEQMKSSISQAVHKLESAKIKISYSKELLKTSYFSQTAERKINKYEDEIQEIDTLISRLNNTILPEINNEINSINTKIKDKEDRILLLEKKWYSL